MAVKTKMVKECLLLPNKVVLRTERWQKSARSRTFENKRGGDVTELLLSA